MSLGTILLIAVAAAVVFLMFRVGRGSHEAAHVHAAVSPPNPDEQNQAEPRGHAVMGKRVKARTERGTGAARHLQRRDLLKRTCATPTVRRPACPRLKRSRGCTTGPAAFHAVTR